MAMTGQSGSLASELGAHLIVKCFGSVRSNDRERSLIYHEDTMSHNGSIEEEVL